MSTPKLFEIFAGAHKKNNRTQHTQKNAFALCVGRPGSARARDRVMSKHTLVRIVFSIHKRLLQSLTHSRARARGAYKNLTAVDRGFREVSVGFFCV